MDLAFFVSTPYQLIISIHLKDTLFKQDNVDLYLLNHFNDARDTAERLNYTEHNFRIVKFIDTKKITDYLVISNNVKRYLRRAHLFSKYKSIAESYFNFSSEKYDEVFFSFPDAIIQIATMYLFSFNNKLKVNLFEDGIGSYNFNLVEISNRKKFLNIFLFKGEILDKYNSLYLFHPKLIVGKNNSIKIKKIPEINPENVLLKELINYVFKFKETDIINEKFIYFEQPMNNNVSRIDETVASIITQITDVNIIAKLHPRTRNFNLYKEVNVYKNQNKPWEVISFNTNINKKVLIAYSSTALITNKLIFDAEPSIIFLYNLKELENYKWIPNGLEELVERIKDIYSQPEKIYVPNSVCELKQILKNLK